MAVPSIVWRNPNYVQPPRRWTKLEREPNRVLYIVLESVSAPKNTWDGLPTLEMIKGGATANRASDPPPLETKKTSLWSRL